MKVNGSLKWDSWKLWKRMLPTKIFPGQFLLATLFHTQFDRMLMGDLLREGWGGINWATHISLHYMCSLAGRGLGIRKGVKITLPFRCFSYSWRRGGGAEGRCTQIGSVLLEGDAEEGEIPPCTSLEFLWTDNKMDIRQINRKKKIFFNSYAWRFHRSGT